MPLCMRRFNYLWPVVEGRGCGNHQHGCVRAGYCLGPEPDGCYPQKTAYWAGRYPAPVCCHTGVSCVYPRSRSHRGVTAASTLVISTEFRAGVRLVVVPSRREADPSLLRSLGGAAQSRRTSARSQAQNRFPSTAAPKAPPPLTRVNGQISSKNLALSS